MTRAELATWCADVTEQRDETMKSSEFDDLMYRLRRLPNEGNGMTVGQIADALGTDSSTVVLLIEEAAETTGNQPEPLDTSLEAARQAYEARKRLNQELAEAVREARKTHSLAEIARELGVSRQRVFQIEKGL